jgi:transposase-like protein
MEHSYISTRRLWKCKGCKKQFSVKLGTIFEDSPLGLDKWLPAVWLIANSKNGISSHELGRALGVTQKSAWFMLHRIRLAMQTGTFSKLDGAVEVDETYIGGKARNMHKSVKARKITATGVKDKTAVLGMRQRDGKVRAMVVPDGKRETLRQHVLDNIEPGSKVYTDENRAYAILAHDYEHETVDHAERYVDGKVHTNSLENFWSLLKRGLHGTYVSVEPFHLFRYLDERVFTYNLYDATDYGRFRAVLRRVAGRRLTYAELTGKP